MSQLRQRVTTPASNNPVAAASVAPSTPAAVSSSSSSSMKSPSTPAASSVPSSSSSMKSPSTPATSSSPPASSVPSVGYRLPENMTLQNAIKWAIIEDKPIMMDYWADSLDKKVLIGVKENSEKLLVKSVDEYTSPIIKIFKHNTDFIIMTENSIYLVDAAVDVKKIS